MQLDSVSSMWRNVLLYTVYVTVGIYFIVGLVAATLHAGKLARGLLVTAASALVGLATAAVLGSVPALLIAALYSAVPADMPSYHAILWGCGQGLAITMLNAGMLHRLL